MLSLQVRRERARWVRRRTDPWETEFVDLAAGGRAYWARSGASVESSLADQTDAFRDAIRYVALDPSAPYASAVHRLLPRRPNQMVIRMRQRVTQQQLGRSGHRNDTVWANRRMLLRGREQLP